MIHVDRVSPSSIPETMLRLNELDEGHLTYADHRGVRSIFVQEKTTDFSIVRTSFRSVSLPMERRWAPQLIKEKSNSFRLISNKRMRVGKRRDVAMRNIEIDEEI